MKAVIFDRDGTLLDSRDMYLHFMRNLHAAYAVDCPDDETLMRYDVWEAIMRGDLHVGPVRVRDRIDEVPRAYMHHGRLFPGVAEALNRLRERGLRTAVVSSWVASQATRDLCRRLAAAGHPDFIFTRDDLGGSDLPEIGSAKVKRILIARALSALGLTGPETVVVGNSPDDIAAGKAVGARTIAVRTGNGAAMADRIAALAPDAIIDSVADLDAALADPNAGLEYAAT